MTFTRVLAQATVSDLDRAVIWYAAATATAACPHRPPDRLPADPTRCRIRTSPTTTGSTGCSRSADTSTSPRRR